MQISWFGEKQPLKQAVKQEIVRDREKEAVKACAVVCVCMCEYVWASVCGDKIQIIKAHQPYRLKIAPPLPDDLLSIQLIFITFSLPSLLFYSHFPLSNRTTVCFQIS